MRQKEMVHTCLQCGEEITYGDEVYMTEDGDCIGRYTGDRENDREKEEVG